MNKAFASYHPVVSFSFFVLIFILAMLLMHPVFVGLNLISACLFSWFLNGLKGLRFNLKFGLPMFLLVALANPLLNHRGKTVLFFFRDNPITLEATMYGLCSAASLIGIIVWFSCYNKVITSDKFLYLFAKVIPSIALLITMSIRMVYKLRGQLKMITAAQHAIGLDAKEGQVRQRIRRGMRTISILLSWAMEDGIETSDSMKARGYGLKNRSTFSLFKFSRRDGVMLGIIMALGAFCWAGYFAGYGVMRFYPSIAPLKTSSPALGMYLCFFALALMPSLIELRENVQWRSYKSMI
ncbi:energy-coupling factor transporter transmembrane component T [Desulfosporosinus youngiae]|uniref:ABC-type cobalt transport system, permease component CbiQ n=1 Tax=Desulfosporosinus youngiae DSM 17734 TaxID=768710 RepID=H5Y5R8_9FIRM|nr:energy-coupling factor transporter transmembrane component T [Desulfosporosinus youngiae]EHQ90794.1 ABC-type cobalt transport system, permease component CbiQ [Desulfosporosinus youngiae DSM 17734]